MMQIKIDKEKIFYKNTTILTLSIVAIILIIGIFYQHIKIKNIQHLDSYIFSMKTPKEKAAVVGETLSKEQETEYKNTVKQLKLELESLQTEQVKMEIASSENASAITPIRKLNLERIYSVFFQRSNFTSDQIEEFMNIMADAPGPRGDKENQLRLNAKSEEEMNEGLQKLEALAYEYDERMHEFLGDENYEKWVQYYNCRGIFESDPVEEYEKILDQKDDMINQEQEDALVAAMSEEFQNFNSKFVPQLKGPPSFRINARDENTIINVIKNLDYLEKAYLECAKPILSETQMKNYEVFIKSSFKERKDFGAQFFDYKSEG